MPPSRLITRKCIYACACRDALKFVNLDLLAYVARTRLHVFRILRWFGGKGGGGVVTVSVRLYALSCEVI